MSKLFRVVEYSVQSNGTHASKTHKANLPKVKASAMADKLNRAQDLPSTDDAPILSYAAEPMS